MTDIVERLRLMNSISGFANPFARDAADEITRLRAEVERMTASRDLAVAATDAYRAEVERLRAGGCARDQKTTQWCAEAEALQAEVAKLREALRQCANLISNINGSDDYHVRLARAALAAQEGGR